MSTVRTTVLALTAAAALLTTGGIAAAESGTAAAGPGAPSPKAAATGDGARALCKRVPRIEKRLERALERLEGKASQRGSVARLEKRVARAKDAGHTEIATFLGNKLTHRKKLPATLEKRQKDVAAVKTWCEKNDNGKNDNGKSEK